VSRNLFKDTRWTTNKKWQRFRLNRLETLDIWLDRLDRYWRQGFKTAWRLNEDTTDHPWTTTKNMAGMGYTSTLAILSHALHAHIERFMKTEDVACQMM
jgi:hypothetical protein